MSKKSNFIFWGTPDVASETLEVLKENGFTPSLVVTSRDMPQGRKMIVTPPPVKVWAEKNNIPYIQPEKLDTKEVWDILETNTPDLFIVVAYGKIMPENIINMPKLGSLNIHYSLLPKYRGASPVESAILNGDTKTGITIQKMQFEMDKGPIVAEEIVSILSTETAPELRARLIKIGAELLVKILPNYLLGKTTPQSQDESLATYCKKIKKEDGLINLKDNGVKNYNKFRAYALWPRTFFFENGKRIIVTKARLESDKFIIEKIIPENGKEKDYKEITSSNP
jgi:methionyl-tRNA formyltransferase